jgi:hypothetical protein
MKRFRRAASVLVVGALSLSQIDRPVTHAQAQPPVQPSGAGLNLAPRAVLPKPASGAMAIASAPAAGGYRSGAVVVKFREGTGIRLRGGALAAELGTLDAADVSRLGRAGLDAAGVTRELPRVAQILGRHRGARLERLFTRPEAVLAQEKHEGELRSGKELADLNLYYFVPAGVASAAALVDELNALDIVEIAYPEPETQPAQADLAPTTASYVANQGYRGAAPAGINAVHARIFPGARGDRMRIADVEGGWTLNHEDLGASLFTRGTNTTDQVWRDHGTAVLGEMVGGDNAYGVTGLVPRARFGVSSVFGVASQAVALDNAAAELRRGDVLLIELHNKGPVSGETCVANCAQFEFIAIEFWQAQYDVIAAATARGIIVVEAAGNGSMGLDAARYNRAFDRTFRDSGAIIVGAGISTSRAPQIWSNSGSRVDVQAWGDSVMTLGYGDHAKVNGTDQRQWYTRVFGGTSSASPIVVGAATSVQGVRLARRQPPLSPRMMRHLLRNTGTAQAADARQIGPQPNLRQAIPLGYRQFGSINDFNGDGKEDVLIRSSSSIGILTRSGSHMTTLMKASNGASLGGWVFNAGSDQVLGAGDFNADGRDDIVILSSSQIGILTLSGSSLTPLMRQPTGSLFGSWWFSATGDEILGTSDFNGDGRDDILIRSGWGIGILTLNGSTLTTVMLQPSGTTFGGWRFDTANDLILGIKDFNADGRADILLTSAWGIGILTHDGGASLTSVTLAPNGSRFGGWLFDSRDNLVVGLADFSNDGQDDILIQSGWGIGILTFDGAGLTSLMLAPNGTAFGSWTWSSASNQVLGTGDYNNDGKDDILVMSSSAIGILNLSGSSLTTLMKANNETRFSTSGWLFSANRDQVLGSLDVNNDGKDDIVIQSSWGMAVLSLSGSSLTSQFIAQNSTVFGSWTFDSAAHGMQIFGTIG